MPSSIGPISANSSNVSHSSLTVSSISAAVDNYAVAWGSLEGTTSSAPTVSLSLSGTSTWTTIYLRSYTNAAGNVVNWFSYAQVTSAISFGNLNISYSAATARSVAQASAVAGQSLRTPSITAYNSVGSTTNTYTLNSAGNVPVGSLALGILSMEYGTNVASGDNDTSGGSWSPQTFTGVGTTTTGVGVTHQWKVPTTLGPQTFDGTISIATRAAGRLVIFNQKYSRTASGSGVGTQTALKREKLPRTASGSGVGTQTAVGNTIAVIQRTATGSGLGSATALKREKLPRTATGSGVGTSTALKREKLPRTATGAGLGTATSTTKITFRRTAFTRVNLIPNPSFETNTTGWVFSGGSTGTRITTDFVSGIASLKVTSTTTSYNGAIISPDVSVIPNATYRLSAYCRNLSGSTRVVYIGVQWYTSAGVYISEINSAGQGSLSTAAGWVRRDASGTAPANATKARVFMLSGTTGLLAGWETLFDAVLLEQSTTLYPYIDTTGGALSAETAAPLRKVPRTASGSGVGTSTALKLRKARRTTAPNLGLSGTILLSSNDRSLNNSSNAGLGVTYSEFSYSTNATSTGVVSEVEMFISKSATATGTIHVEIWTAPSSIPVALLATSNTINITSLGTGTSYDANLQQSHFMFNSPFLTLTSGTRYAIVVRTTGLTGTVTIWGQTTATSTTYRKLISDGTWQNVGGVYGRFTVLSPEATRLIKRTRIGSASGTGTSTALKQIPPVGINWSYWGTNALLNSP